MKLNEHRKSFLIVFLMFSVWADLFALEIVPFDAVVASDHVRMRSKPTVQGEVVSRLDLGSEVTVLQQSEKSELLPGLPEKNWWFKVKSISTGQIGWLFGAFLYKTLSSDDNEGPPSDVGEIRLSNVKPPLGFAVEVFKSLADLGPQEPEYDEHYLVALREQDGGGLWFFAIGTDLLQSIGRLSATDDGLLSMASGMGGSQRIRSVSASKGATVTLVIAEQSNAGMVYRIELNCTLNKAGHRFEVVDGNVAIEHDPNKVQDED